MLIWFWQAMVLWPLAQLHRAHPDFLTDPDVRAASVGIVLGGAVRFWMRAVLRR